MFQNKFPYQKYDRLHDDHGRFYVIPDSRPLPSVTTIMSNTIDHSWVEEWKQRVGEEEAASIVQESCDIGSGMHEILEKYYTGETVGKVFPISRIFAKTIVKRGLCNVSEVWGVEGSSYIHDIYAGTSDLVGIHSGKESIIDYKNSRREKLEEDIEEYKMQLTAYADAHNSMFGTDIKKGVIMMMIRNGNYVEFVLEGNEFKKYLDKWWKVVEAYYEKFGVVCPNTDK
jgi:genome maintenance exonuclease 1